MARLAWLSEREEALRIVNMIRQTQPGFRPIGAAAPASYQLLYFLLGFRVAETIADWKRGIAASVRGA